MATGDIVRDVRSLSYNVVEIDEAVYRCSCNKPLTATLDVNCTTKARIRLEITLDGCREEWTRRPCARPTVPLLDRTGHHVDRLKDEECIHAKAVRRGQYDQPHGTHFIYGAITPISDRLRLYVTFPDDDTPGVVRVTQSKVCCLLCHKETCTHVSELSGSPYLDQATNGDENEVEEIQIEWRTESSSLCAHDEHIRSKSKEVTIVGEKGVLRKETITVETSICCKHVVTPTEVFCLSEGMLIELPLLRFYESLLAMNGTTLSGYCRTLNDYARETGRSSEDIISLSSLSRAWNSYLSQLNIPDAKFGCERCGQYPSALVFDGIQLGIRASIANEKPLTKGKYTFLEYSLSYLGKLQQRQVMLQFLDGKGQLPNVIWPFPIPDLLTEAITDSHQVRAEYKELLKMLFANSPPPLIFQAGIDGERRELLDRLIGGSLNWAEEELSLQRDFPIIYKSIRPLITNQTYPECVRRVLEFVLTESDLLLREQPHVEAYYGPPVESRLESFPLWPLERGVTTYSKDKTRKGEEQLECAEKVVGDNKRLSPGLLLVMCPHRRPYGFRVLKSPESVRDVFEVILTRLGSHMPSTVIYDNACRLAVFSLAREPNRFANVRFVVDRFHHYNHKSCAHSLRLRSYQSDPIMSSLNSQSCEQTNALLRHLGNSLPFMSLSRYIKTIQLSLSRN